MDNTLIDRIVGVFSRAAMPIVSCALAMAIAFIPGTALAGADDEGDLDAPNAAAGAHRRNRRRRTRRSTMP